ncbi:Hypothetical predicted protein, partial [Pelobates cultripes]
KLGLPAAALNQEDQNIAPRIWYTCNLAGAPTFVPRLSTPDSYVLATTYPQ